MDLSSQRICGSASSSDPQSGGGRWEGRQWWGVVIVDLEIPELTHPPELSACPSARLVEAKTGYPAPWSAQIVTQLQHYFECKFVCCL